MPHPVDKLYQHPQDLPGPSPEQFARSLIVVNFLLGTFRRRAEAARLMTPAHAGNTVADIPEEVIASEVDNALLDIGGIPVSISNKDTGPVDIHLLEWFGRKPPTHNDVWGSASQLGASSIALSALNLHQYLTHRLESK